jgi:DNA-binding CsgD family transcriptional regulator
MSTESTENLPSRLWEYLAQSPGIGIALTNVEGELLYLNDEELRFFEGHTDVDYHGKHIRDFHSAEFVEERLALIRRVTESKQPAVITHIHKGRCIQSTVWPIVDLEPPHDRVLVVSRQLRGEKEGVDTQFLNVESDFIDLGELDVLSPRELEVLVLLGHGQSIPEVAKILFRSQKTIEKHREAIGRKLSLHSERGIGVERRQ